MKRSFRWWCASLAVVCSMFVPIASRAAPDPRSLRNQSEDDFLDGEIDAEDFIASTFGRPQGFGRATPAYIGIEAYKIEHVATSSEFGALVVLELPLERFARSAAPLATVAWPPEPSLLAAPPAPSLLVPGSLAQSAPVRTEPTARPAQSMGRGDPSPRAESVVHGEPSPVVHGEPLPRPAPPTPRSETADRAEPAARPAEPAVRAESPLRGARSSAPLAVTTNVARACIRAALRMVGLSDDNRLDSVAARSRSSAVLPELRLRALRTMGESGRVSLSEDDPSRYVASGAATNVLEARLTFRLDRLLFADEELAVERVRIDRSELRARTTAKALAALFEWQRAYSLASDPGLAPEDHLTAVLRELEACAILDAMTGGWFGGYRAEFPPPPR